MYCTKCGKQIADSAKFCGFCGQENVAVLETNKPVIGQNITGAPVTTPSWLVDKQPSVNNGLRTQKNSISKEISNNKVLFAIPYVYLVVQVIRQILFRNIHHFDSTIILSIIGFVASFFLATVWGGFVVAVKTCSPKFKWVYLIPYFLVEIYFVLSALTGFNRIAGFLFELLWASVVFVILAIVAALKESDLGKDNSLKSILSVTTISVIAINVIDWLINILQYKFVYEIELEAFFRAWPSYLLALAVQLIGALIAAAIGIKTKITDEKTNTVR